jgi:hypothetical protein
VKTVSVKILIIMSCLTILATLSIFGQNEFNPKFNKKPLQDFAVNLNQKLDSKEVDLDKPFSVTLDGYLTKEGKIDVKRSRFTKSEGDEKIIAVAKKAIEAVNDTGFFSYLSDLQIEKVKMVFSQDENNVVAILTSEMLDKNRARTVASAFKVLFTIAKMKVKEEEIKILLGAATSQSNDNNFILNFLLPKSEAHRLLKNELQKQKEKRYSNSGE